MFYAIGDIHGHADQLDRALSLIEVDGGPDAEVIFLGDYTDRGPDVRGLIQRLIDGQEEGRNWHCVRGNHDRMFLRFVRDAVQHDPAIKSGKGYLHPAIGGPATLASYMPDFSSNHPDWPGMDAFIRDGVDGGDPSLIAEIQAAATEAVPQDHTDWIANLPLWIERPGHVFVHAGIRPGIAMPDQVEDDLVWIREDWLSDKRDHGFMVVHGHTALDYPRHEGNRINLDGGAGFGRPLIPAVFDGENWHLLTDQGRALLWPGA